ncbi:hypothetical protein [Gelidibacter japonicus]|uniref:hypothetical protein n=1 Tax=Gelidibacter japonicus TaxID=1962232 RepID=UPI0013D1C06B|nr:hypothetical protein [Gelidibacter japonicus]
MKKSIYFIASITLLLMFSGCSSSKVLSSWKGDNADAAKDNNFLVIARTANNQARIAFENEIVQQLSAKGIKATSSYTKFPKINPDQELSEDKIADMVSMVKNEGFDGIVLTVLKSVENLTQTTQDGGYYAGGNYYGYYPRYYGGFNRYYGHPMSYSTYGNYVPATTTTRTSHNYVLETVFYDLAETGEEQLLAVVTSKIEDPSDASKAAADYVKGIVKSFDAKTK